MKTTIIKEVITTVHPRITLFYFVVIWCRSICTWMCFRATQMGLRRTFCNVEMNPHDLMRYASRDTKIKQLVQIYMGYGIIPINLEPVNALRSTPWTQGFIFKFIFLNSFLCLVQSLLNVFPSGKMNYNPSLLRLILFGAKSWSNTMCASLNKHTCVIQPRVSHQFYSCFLLLLIGAEIMPLHYCLPPLNWCVLLAVLIHRHATGCQWVVDNLSKGNQLTSTGLKHAFEAILLLSWNSSIDKLKH